MKITNKTRKTILSENILVPNSLLDQSLGLLKYKTPSAMLFHTRFGIHTFGMHYSIDVLILDKQSRVVAMKEHLKPNRIFLWNPKFETVLELPTRTIEKSKTNIGDNINIK